MYKIDNTNYINSLRHTIAGDLGQSMEVLKSRMIILKVENMALGAEREELGERAGMVANTALLGDFRNTLGEIGRSEEVNSKMHSQIKYFYDL